MALTTVCAQRLPAAAAVDSRSLRATTLRGRGVEVLATRPAHRRAPTARGNAVTVRAHKVQLNFEGQTHVLEVSEDQNILEVRDYWPVLR